MPLDIILCLSISGSIYWDYLVASKNVLARVDVLLSVVCGIGVNPLHQKFLIFPCAFLYQFL